MSTISGTIKGCSLVHANPSGLGARKTYLLSVDFAAYTGSTDSGALADVDLAIPLRVRNGKVFTTRGAVCVGPGADTAGQAVYTAAITDTSGDFTFNLTTAAGVELTSSTACTGVQILVTGDES